MELDTFKRLLELHKNNEKYLDSIDEILGVDLSETVTNTSFWEVWDIVWNNEYTEKGADWISWFVFERSDTDEPQAWDNGVPILNSIEELWKYVETNYKKVNTDLENSYKSGYSEGYKEGVESQRNT